MDTFDAITTARSNRDTRTRRRRASLAAATALLTVATGVAVAGPSTATPSARAPSAGAAAAGAVLAKARGIAWRHCDRPGSRRHHLECGKLTVPLDWSRPNGTKIKLAVIRYLAPRPRKRIGSMFVNPGGPGQSGVHLVRTSGADFAAWGRGRFDVVGWDPRGTNGSSPVRCFRTKAAETRFWRGVSIPNTAAESRARKRKSIELARRCGALSGKLLSHITTADTARDLDALRRAVGDRKLTYVGLSYGSMIGQTYANMFPGHVRVMMLDGIVDAVDQTTSMERNISNAVSSADEVFRQFIRLCQRAGRRECALAGHGESVAHRVAGLFARARRAPIPAPHVKPPGKLSYGDLLVSTFTPLRLPLTWPEFAKHLEAAVNGDGSALKAEARAMQTPAGMTSSTTSSAISCGDGPPRLPVSAWPRAIARFTHAGRLWGRVLGWWLWAPCAAHWQAHSTDRYTGPWNAKTRTPILLVSARYDPGTPYRNAVAAEHRLGNAVLLTLNGYGHPSYQVPSKCIDNARKRYLVERVLPPRGKVCQPDQTPFP
jgi:pimeloyl-ACP methyl ester carboxylesterase